MCVYVYVYIYTLPAKIWNIFSFQRFFVFCGVCKLFIYLINIPTSRYYFGGVNSHPIVKWTTPVKNDYYDPFSWLDAGQNSNSLMVRLLPHLFVCFIGISCTLSLFIYHLVWCDRHGISTVGPRHKRTPGVVLVYHKVMYIKALPITSHRSFHIESKKWSF